MTLVASKSLSYLFRTPGLDLLFEISQFFYQIWVYLLQFLALCHKSKQLALSKEIHSLAFCKNYTGKLAQLASTSPQVAEQLFD